MPHVAYATRFCGKEFGRIDLTQARAGTGTAAPGQPLLPVEGSVTGVITILFALETRQAVPENL